MLRRKVRPELKLIDTRHSLRRRMVAIAGAIHRRDLRVRATIATAVAARGKIILTGAAGTDSDLFVEGFLVVIPGAVDCLAVSVPVRIGIGGGPIFFQAILHVRIPF